MNDSTFSYLKTPVSVKNIKTGKSYSFTHGFSFESESMLVLNFTGLQTEGFKSENLTIEFLPEFLSTDGAQVWNKLIWGYPKKFLELPSLVEAAGKISDASLKVSIVSSIALNQLVGGSSPLMWGFVNTI